MRYLLAMLLIAALGFAGCQSTREINDESRSPQDIEPLDRRLYVERQIIRLTDENPIHAAQLIINEEIDANLFLENELADYKEKVAGALVAGMDAAIVDGNYQGAREMQVALGYLSEQHNQPDISLLELRAHLEQENYLPLLYSLRALSSLDDLTTGEINDIAEVAYVHNHRQQLARLLVELSARGEGVDQKFRNYLSDTSVDFSEMLRGTVTVIVDRGFKIERGLGVPDMGIGSGFFVDARGYLITNYHVIVSEVDPTYEGYSRLFVRLPGDGTSQLPAKVISYDRTLDIALVKVEITPEYVFPVFSGVQNGNIRAADSAESPTSGTRIFALGSPIGLQNSISSGIISAVERRLLPIGEVLQIDVPVNPGNSGGPLINEHGALIGVVFAGLSDFQGINFAIPIRWVWHTVPQLFSTSGEVTRWWAGASLFANGTSDDGLEVQYLFPGSPAEDIGMQIDDTITSIDGTITDSITAAQFLINRHRGAALVPVTWVREGSAYRQMLLLTARPEIPLREALKIDERARLFPPLFGMEVSQLGSTRSSRYVVRRVYSGTIADQLGLSESDPFRLFRWEIDEERRAVLMQIVIQKRRAGFTDSGIQVATPLDLPSFI